MQEKWYILESVDEGLEVLVVEPASHYLPFPGFCQSSLTIMDANRRSPEKEDMRLPVTASLNSHDRRSQIIEIAPVAETRWQYLCRYFTTSEGWIGNYVRS